MAEIEDVITGAIEELGADFTQYNYADEEEWLEWLTRVATNIVEAFSAAAGDSWDLDNDKHMEAAVFELASVMLRRLVNQYYSGVLTSEKITLGPLALEPLTNGPVAKDIINLIASYHNRALAKLSAAGVPSRKGAIRVYNPADKGDNIIVI